LQPCVERVNSSKKEEAMTVEDVSKACQQVGAGYDVYFSEDGMSFTPIKELVVVGDKAVLFANYDEMEGAL
jgi:hypothetical protein